MSNEEIKKDLLKYYTFVGVCRYPSCKKIYGFTKENDDGFCPAHSYTLKKEEKKSLNKNHE